MAHRSARLTVHGRKLLVERVLSGRPVSHVAAEMGASRPTGYEWLARWHAEGDAGRRRLTAEHLEPARRQGRFQPPLTSGRP